MLLSQKCNIIGACTREKGISLTDIEIDIFTDSDS